MNKSLREFFDHELEVVLSKLPKRVHELLDEVPMYVDDYPSKQIMRRVGVRHRGNLCGLYTGIPLTKKSVQHSGQLSDAIYLYREGIMNMSRDRDGGIDEPELRRQIRITILHELGHYHGFGEKELVDLGY